MNKDKLIFINYEGHYSSLESIKARNLLKGMCHVIATVGKTNKLSHAWAMDDIGPPNMELFPISYGGLDYDIEHTDVRKPKPNKGPVPRKQPWKQ